MTCPLFPFLAANRVATSFLGFKYLYLPGLSVPLRLKSQLAIPLKGPSKSFKHTQHSLLPVTSTAHAVSNHRPLIHIFRCSSFVFRPACSLSADALGRLKQRCFIFVDRSAESKISSARLQTVPQHIWVHYCRKHYQHSRYRNPKECTKFLYR
jgi:hypothetical protein